MEPRRAKPGTRPKGERKAITVRTPADHHRIFDEARQQLGYASLSDYVAALLAEHHGLPVPPYVHRPGPLHEQPAIPGTRVPELRKAG